MQDYTLEELFDFTQNEQKMIKEVLSESVHEEDTGPSATSILLITQYARTLSVRHSEKLGSMMMLLN